MKKYLILSAFLGVLVLAGCSCTKKETINFPTDAYELTTADKIELDGAITKLKASKSEKVKIYGYTDSTGTEAYNMNLSVARAESASNYLKANGIATDRITLGAFGDGDPVATNKTKEGRKENRRVNVILYK